MADQLTYARTNFRYSLELDGVNNFLVQEITSPEPEIAEILQGAPINEPDIKLPGKPKFGDLTLRKILPYNGSDTWIVDWMARVIENPTERVTGFLKEYEPDGVTVVQEWVISQVWPKKRGALNYVSEGDGDKLIEEIIFSLRGFYPRGSAQWRRIVGD